MKKFLISLLTLLTMTTIVFADDKQDALNFFNSYVNSANTYNPAITALYSPNAKIIRQVVKPDGTTVNVNTDTATYINQMKISQTIAKARKYTNSYSNVSVKTLGKDTYKISSLRQPKGETYKLKTYMVIKLQPNGKWLITEELMQTKEQIFLRYAKK